MTRSLAELIDTTDPASKLIEEWSRTARNQFEMLPVERVRGEQTLLKLQVSTRSPMGALAYETGGVLFDHGWLRFLGAGSPRLPGNLLSWNGIGDEPLIPPMKGAFVIAHDAVGGFFAINDGAFEGAKHNIFYLAPDTLAWEDLGKSYSDLLYWAFHGNLEQFYQNARWNGWSAELANLGGDHGVSIYPPLWAKGELIAERSRRAVPMTELWGIHNKQS